MADFNYPSASFGQAIELPIPPIGNSTGFGTNIPGTVVQDNGQYSSLTNDPLGGYGIPSFAGTGSFPTDLKSGLDALNNYALGIEGGTLGAMGSVISGQNPVTAAQQGATTLQALGTSLTLSRASTIIVGLIALIAGFWLLGSTSLTDAVRSLKPA